MTEENNNGSLKNKIEEHVQKTGTLDSASMSKLQQGETPSGESEQNESGPVRGAVGDTVDKKEFMADNPMAEGGSTFRERGSFPEAVDVEITEEDRNAFLDAVVNGERMTRPFSIFGGKLTGTIRARTAPETRAMVSVIKKWMDSGHVNTKADYDAVHMPAVLTAQIAELNGTEYPCIREPLMYSVDGDGNDIDPGWLPMWKKWYDKPEGIIVGLFEAVKRFEYKYWTMVGRAEDQNFWSPAEST